MANSERLRSLVEAPDETAKSARLKKLVSPSPVGQFMEGLRYPVERTARALFGSRFDPETGRIPEIETPEPESLPGRLGAGVSESAMLAAPVGAAANRLEKVVTGTGRAASAARNVLSGIGQSFTRSPGKFLAAESALGATSAAGGYAAEQMFPESDAARFIGEIAGGLAPGAVGAAGRGAVKAADVATDLMPIARTAKRAALNTWDDVKRTVDARTAGARASARFSRAAGDTPVQDIASAMDEPLLGEARALMTPAQIAGNPGLLSIEKSLAESMDSLRNKREEDLIRLNEVLKGAFSMGGNVDTARGALQRTRQDYMGLLNERVRVAALKADESIQRMIPELGEEEANRLARRELETALKDATTQERQLFAKIDQKAPVPTSNTVRQFRDMVSEYGKAGAPSIPGYARLLFDPNRGTFLGSTTSVKEMRQAQSQFREIARSARVGAQPDRKLARFADSMADSITDDLALAAGDNPEIIRDAVNFSRAKHEVFSSGTVGKILRTASDSGEVVPEMLTLNRTLGMMGPEGANAFDDIVSAAAMARDKAGYAGADNLAGAMKSYVQNEFINSVVRNGRVDKGLAQTFIRNNDSVLSRFPEVKQGIEAAAEAQSGLEAREMLRGVAGAAFDDPAVSKAALFINKGPQAAFKSVFDSKNPTQEMKTLVEMVKRDSTGEALSGLRQGFYDYFVDSATEGGFVSGSKMADLVKSSKFKSAMGELLTAPERSRLDVIIRTAQRADAARAARPSTEGVTGDKLSKTADMVLGILGAAHGRRVSSALGGGTIQIPGIFAEKFRQLGSLGMVNPAKRLIVDALQDEKIFREVLMAPVTSGEVSKQTARRLNAWAAGAVARELGPQPEEEE